MKTLSFLAQACAILAGLLLTLVTLITCASLIGRNTTGATLQYRSGTGVVESVARAPAPLTAAAGGGTAQADPLNRLTIRMDDGRRQYIDTDSGEFQRGMRVRLTDERLIERL